jgi:hypothetical protein
MAVQTDAPDGCERANLASTLLGGLEEATEAEFGVTP